MGNFRLGQRLPLPFFLFSKAKGMGNNGLMNRNLINKLLIPVGCFFKVFLKVRLRGRCCKIRYKPLAVHAAERSCNADSDLKLGWRKCRKISKLSNLWKHDKLIHLLFFKSFVKWEGKKSSWDHNWICIFVKG